MSIAGPLRRQTGAKWFQPVVKIGSTDTYEQVLAPIDGALPDMDAPLAPSTKPSSGGSTRFPSCPAEKLKVAEEKWKKHQPVRRTRFIAEFIADNYGDLFLYVNDAINVFWLGGGYGLFYQNNRGTASVWLQQKPLPEKPLEQAAR